ncbi:hypothetical protein [Paracoccus sp. (in: a-proteobacteria)]|uniref:hypothetical protein n=1 Tax=Paracoccus sp. TaxID=267 RepID=UPI0026E0A909|nr:hypothetical protein [Paracoccus sp. (in: a-proteobacteria)]MDO5646814.1 hypothetical protein [Paracoccus sp. (in: a-proteobacteria)]
MRGVMILGVLAVAGCGAHSGMNPNYQMGGDAYGQYKIAREAALTGTTVPSQVIPVARPFYAPTAADIAGQNPVPPAPVRWRAPQPAAGDAPL